MQFAFINSRRKCHFVALPRPVIEAPEAPRGGISFVRKKAPWECAGPVEFPKFNGVSDCSSDTDRGEFKSVIKYVGGNQPPCIEFSENLPTLEQLKTYLFAESLCRTEGNRTAAADMLGISRQTLIRKLNVNKNNDCESKGDIL